MRTKSRVGLWRNPKWVRCEREPGSRKPASLDAQHNLPRHHHAGGQAQVPYLAYTGLTYAAQRYARSSDVMNWIPGTIFRLNRSSLVIKRSHRALAA